MRQRPPARHDFRLVPAALGSWGAEIWATGAGSREILWVVGGLVALIAALGLAHWYLRVAFPLNFQVFGRGMRISILALGIASALLCITAIQQREWEESPLRAVEDSSGRVQIEVQLTGDPQPISSTRWGQERWLVRARLKSATHAGTSTTDPVRVVLIGSESLAEMRAGQEIAAAGTARQTAAGQPERLLIFIDQNMRTLTTESGPHAWGGHLRERFMVAVDHLPQPALELVPAMVIGNKSNMTPQTRQALQDTSLTHLTAVSGAHTTVLLAAVLALFRPPLGWPRALRVGVRALIGLATLAGFTLVTGPQPAILRAGVMAVVGLMGVVVGRRSQALAALCVAVIGLLTFDPWFSRGLGFTLSVLSTAAIILLAGPLTQRLVNWRIPRFLALPLAVSASAQIACLPVLLTVYPQIPLYSLPANVLAAPVFPLITLPGAAGLVSSLFSTELASGVLWLAVVPATIIGATATWFSRLPAATVSWPPSLATLSTGVMLTLVLVVLVLWRAQLLRVLKQLFRRPLRGRFPLSIAAVASLSLIVAALAVGNWLPHRSATDGVRGTERQSAWFALKCDVGQADALLLRSQLEVTVLIDTGLPDGRAADCLRENGVKQLDLLVLTHWHLDHVGGVEHVLRQVDVAEVWLPAWSEPRASARPAEGALRAADVEGTLAVSGETRQYSDLNIEVLWPTQRALDLMAPGADDGKSVNDLSTVVAVKMRAADQPVSVIALGDVEESGQRGLARELRAGGAPSRFDVVKMAHHGSSSQVEDLAQILQPRIALIGVGEDNEYGHPSPEAWHLYAGLGAEIGATDRLGQITVSADSLGGLVLRGGG